jgi:low temperature requirement protein LtrA
MNEGIARSGLRFPIITRMRPRDPEEAHRAATPLELLFDLTFVVAIATLVPELAHAIADGHLVEGLVGYGTVFFGIWWAWMNAAWFASAYDCDDGPYRILTMVQMAGVLVLAAGVVPAFEDGAFGTAVAGYVIMRFALVLQWLRAAASDPTHRTTALRFATAIAAVQVLWVIRLTLPEPWSGLTFIVLALAELAVPFWAERPNMTTWHPHHIAERYGLFTIIVLGEGVFAATTAVVASKTEVGATLDLIVLAIAALALLFALWWLYFLEPSGPLLEARRHLGFLWGYGHFFVFGALAAVGAGLEVAAEAITHPIEASALLVAYSIAVPVVVFLVALWWLHTRLGGARYANPAMIVAEVGLFLVAPLATAWIPIAWVVALIAAIAAGLIVVKSIVRREAVRAA